MTVLVAARTLIALGCLNHNPDTTLSMSTSIFNDAAIHITTKADDIRKEARDLIKQAQKEEDCGIAEAALRKAVESAK